MADSPSRATVSVVGDRLPPLASLARRLGALLQQQRQRLGLTQAIVAERAELSVKYLSAIERGEANATVNALDRLATVLEWDPAPGPPLVMLRRRGRPTKDGGRL